MNQVSLALHLNLAACKLKTNDLREAIIECEKSLDIDENNMKAIFRRGQANSKLSEFAKARKVGERRKHPHHVLVLLSSRLSSPRFENFLAFYCLSTLANPNNLHFQKDFECIIATSPTDAPAAKQELARLDKTEDDSKRKEKKVLAGMFAALSSDD
jgi:hypothetical protein